jgi:cytochrome c peroxidase
MKWLPLLLVLMQLAWVGNCRAMHPDAHVWSMEQVTILHSLWLDSLPPVPDDPSNAYDLDPRSVAFGRKLFFDTRLSANGKVSCATCHIPDKGFTDNLPVAHGMDDTTRRSMPLAGTAYSPWQFWDGRADSLWAQALGPIESPAEHGISRTRCALIVQAAYRQEYEPLFGVMPDFSNEAEYPPPARPAPDDAAIHALGQGMTPEKQSQVTRLYTNLGKAIAAFVRTIQPGEAACDQYVRALFEGDVEVMARTFTPEQAMGLKLFIGRAGCVNCHNTPLFTNSGFHKVGVPLRSGFPPDSGRAEGISKVRESEFNCLGPFSDAAPEQCAELRFMDTDTDTYRETFKTPSLRNVADRPPYMHAGQFQTLRQVLEFYRQTAGSRTTDNSGRPAIAHGILSE